jgi:hypothetical protein
MIEQMAVFDAVRRGYNELESSSNAEIINYFSEIDDYSVTGHTSNIKGILFEQQYAEQLVSQGIDAQIFEATNHPVSDIAIFSDEEVVTEIQLKATESVSYIQETLTENPDVVVVATSEVAQFFDDPMVINSGIEEETLENVVTDTLFDDPVNPISPFSVIGWFIGIF